MNDLIRGAISGLAGTAAMTASMAAFRLTGAMSGSLPPREISDNVEEAVGLREHLSKPAFEASWMVQHLAYGAAAGVAYAMTERKLDRPHPIVAGPLYGAALWAFSYAGWLPALGFYPPPTTDKPNRVATMILHHLIYGTTTALASNALRVEASPATSR